MNVSISRRLIDFGLAVLFLAFYLQFYTLVKLNLHDIHGDFIACVFLPFIVAIYSVVRLVTTPYIASYVHMVFDSNGGNDRQGRFFSYIISIFVLAVQLYFISLSLIDKEYMTPGYTRLELIACAACAGLLGLYCTVKVFIKSKGDSLISKLIVGALVFSACASAGWLIGTAIRVMYEMIFLYPEVLRW